MNGKSIALSTIAPLMLCDNYVTDGTLRNNTKEMA